MVKKIACVVLIGLAATACSGQGVNTVSTTSPANAPSGITSSNGGGARAVGNIPNIGVSNGQAVTGGVPNRSGNAY